MHIPLWRKIAIVSGFGILLAIVASISLTYFSLEEPLRPKIQKSHNNALSWLISNYTPQTHLFVYALNPQTGEYPLENNALRQLMASRAIASRSAHSLELQEIHKDNLSFVLKEWYQQDGQSAYVLFDARSKLGANAMLLRTLVASPYFSEYQEEAHAIANGIMALQLEDGSFVPWYVAPEYSNGLEIDYLLTFYSGEALLALIEYYEKTNDPDVFFAISMAVDFYLEKYVTNLEENYYPAYVPWHTLALSAFYDIAPDERYPTAVFIMTDELLELFDSETVMGRFYNPNLSHFGRPHAASDGVYTEGVAYAYELALKVGDTQRAKRYKEVLILGLKNLISLQYKEESATNVLPAYTYLGGLRTNLVDPTIRVDNTQHALDAFEKALTLPL